MADTSGQRATAVKKATVPAVAPSFASTSAERNAYCPAFTRMLPAGRLIRPGASHYRSSLLPDGIEVGSLEDHQIT